MIMTFCALSQAFQNPEKISVGFFANHPQIKPGCVVLKWCLLLKLFPYQMALLLTSLCSLLTLLVMPREDGKVVIVTGGSRRIGYELVWHTLRLGAHVVIGTISSHAPGRAYVEDTETGPETLLHRINASFNAPVWSEIRFDKCDVRMRIPS